MMTKEEGAIMRKGLKTQLAANTFGNADAVVQNMANVAAVLLGLGPVRCAKHTSSEFEKIT